MNSTTLPSKDVRTQAALKRAARLKRAREWHLYLGTLFAPAIVFFALTGALQLFGLHEGHPGEKYQPPVWVQRLGSIHKNQNISVRHGRPPGPPAERKAANAPRPQQPQGEPRSNGERGPGALTMALKSFFLATALGLIFSTVLGIYMAFKFNRSRRLVWGMLVLGTAVPLTLILLMA